MLRLFNTLTRKTEEFIPLNPPKVGMYTCGPTVHDYTHIGNLRTFLLADSLYRILKANGFEVKHVQNITDIDDKIIDRARERDISIKELADEYTKLFLEDVSKLNIISPDVQPKATEHVGKMIKYIEELLKKGLAYVEKDGSVYFDISQFPNYGKLSALEGQTLKVGARISADEYSKDDVQDFALWKSVGPDEMGFDSPWGKGRPGWHIECSIMSQEYLGDTFDIHVGGVDLIFPHHENEIAQSEGKTGKQFVKYFVHGEHLMVDGKKMAKSENNFYTLAELAEKGFDPLAFRYLVLTAHYRDKLNFTWESLQAAQNALNSLREMVRDWDSSVISNKVRDLNSNQEISRSARNDKKGYKVRFMDAINNDLNTPQALAILWEMVKSDYPTSAKAESLLKFDAVLGLSLDQYLGKPLEVSQEVMELVEKREKIRKDGDFEKSDEIRKQIKNLGYIVEDTSSGPKVKQLQNH